MNKKEAMIVFLCILAMTMLCGCDARTRYRLLSPFLDGVPNPDAAALKNQTKDKNAVRGAVQNPEGKKSLYAEHGPYAAKLCEGCHQRGTNKLVMPLENLCLYCHDVNMEKKKIHGPIASGGCRVCHDPHSSANRFLLVSDSKEFCLYCHDKNEIATHEVHQGASAECTGCHDAHSSNSEFLLK